jgi:secreted Zn-dependent insulinase-like peptidase
LYGNYSEGDIAKTQGALKNLAPQTDVELPSLRITQLPSDKRQQLTQVLEHNDSVISWYLQGQDRSVEQQALYALTGQALKSGFFQQLRTEQQLGYIASAFSWSQSRVPGLVMIIQSPSHSSQAVKSAIDGFLARVPTDITEDAFSRHKSALVAEIVEPDKNLSERAEFLWQSLGEGDTSFASREALAQAVQAIAYADWRAFFERDILGAKRSLLVVAPGKYAEVPSEQTLFETPKAVKEANSAFAIEF